MTGPYAQIPHSTQGSSLGEILERVLDKGLVVAGDIKISVAQVELLTIKIRLIVASVDKARSIGINWWEADPNLSKEAAEREAKCEADDNGTASRKKEQELEERLRRLEADLKDEQSAVPTPPPKSRRPRSPAKRPGSMPRGG